MIVLAGTSVFLWNAHRMNLPQQAAAAAALVAMLWLIGVLTQRGGRSLGTAATLSASR